MKRAKRTLYQRNYLRIWRKKNPDRVRLYQSRQARREIEELRPAYIRRQVRSRRYPTTQNQVLERIRMRRAARLLKPMAALSLLRLPPRLSLP